MILLSSIQPEPLFFAGEGWVALFMFIALFACTIWSIARSAMIGLLALWAASVIAWGVTGAVPLWVVPVLGILVIDVGIVALIRSPRNGGTGACPES